MFRLYRPLKKGEFFLLAGDCAQGGIDSNNGGALSYEELDVPIVWDFSHTVAATVTPQLHQLLEWIYDVTGVRPMICLERNNGGASEMERLRVLNKKGKYRLYQAKKFGKTDGENETEILGWQTDGTTRPRLIGDWQDAFNAIAVTIYDASTISHHKTFITNKSGRPEASSGNHDDGVIYMAILYQMYQTEKPDKPTRDPPKPRRTRSRNYMVNGGRR